MLKRAVENIGKVGRYGVKGSFLKLIERLGTAFGVYRRLARLIFAPACRGRRILGVWDYRALPWSFGDPLVFIERLSVLKLESAAEAVDVCVIYDREDPMGHRTPPGGGIVTPENAQDYMLELLPLFSTSPYLGSVFQFDSRDEFYSFIKTNLQRYDIFPPLWEHLAEAYNYDGGAMDYVEVQKFHKNHGYVPHLRVGLRDMAWANWFYKKRLSQDSVPVTISLRQSREPNERNADVKVWMTFMDRCSEVFPEVVFVIVGLREEAHDELRARRNVIFSKDHGTSVMEDLALIRASLMYMGTTSGVNTIAQFSDLPYIIVQLPLQSLRNLGIKAGENVSFATAQQKVFTVETAVTPELLFAEFQGMYPSLDRCGWHNRMSKTAQNKNTHPSTHPGS